MSSTQEPSTIDATIAETASRLRAVSDAARLEAEILLARAIDMPRSFLFAHPDDELDEASLARLNETVERRLAGEPMAYIQGVKEFWSMELMVSPATLVPRPETELLVDIAIREVPRRADWQILDLGTGSGAIALAIARECPTCFVTAVDNDADTLAVAETNVRQWAQGNVDCVLGDWTAPVKDRTFNLIVSNPPYVRSDDPALAELAAEPQSALAAGPDGLDAIRRLANECRNILVDDGLLILEHGFDQSEPVADLLNTAGWRDIQCVDDYAGHPRVTTARHSNQ